VTDRCLAGKFVSLTIGVTNGAAVPASFTVETPYGRRGIGAVDAGAAASAVVNTKRAVVPEGVITVSATAVVDGERVDVTQEIATPVARCG